MFKELHLYAGSGFPKSRQWPLRGYGHTQRTRGTGGGSSHQAAPETLGFYELRVNTEMNMIYLSFTALAQTHVHPREIEPTIKYSPGWVCWDALRRVLVTAALSCLCSGKQAEKLAADPMQREVTRGQTEQHKSVFNFSCIICSLVHLLVH